MKKYNVIYADPPWKYDGGLGKNSRKYGNALASYDCMKFEDLCSLPVADIADQNCALFMWSTWPMYPRAIKLLEAWGFEYKTCAFVWVKEYKNGNDYCGMGYWTRSGTEYCLLAFRGKMERKAKDVYQVIEAPVTKHSEKPPETYNRIERLMGDVPRIELFARPRTPLFPKREGWHTWGNEVENDVSFAI